MNIFRFVGDMSHVLAVILLLLKMWKTRSCAGISGKSQILFALVFLTRYLDLFTFTTFISHYNTIMKVFFMGSSIFIVYLMFFKFRATYDSNHDTFHMEFLVVPVGGLAFLVNHEFSPLESALKAAKDYAKEMQQMEWPMHPPGQILHFVEEEESKLCSWGPQCQYTAVWAQPEDFSTILISHKMVLDHFPDVVLRALSQLNDRNFIPRVHRISGEASGSN